MKKTVKKNGRPKNAESFTWWLNHFGSLPSREVLKEVKFMETQLRKIGDDEVPLVGIASLRALIALINKPDARLFKEIIERVDGKLPTTIKSWRDEWVAALKAGELDPKVVEEELGGELAAELFLAASIEVSK